MFSRCPQAFTLSILGLRQHTSLLRFFNGQLEMKDKVIATLQLMRLDVPVGSLLLLWPTVVALWIVNGGIPPYDLLVLFVIGTVLMRSAGCVINDIADRKIDRQVKRTFQRPLADGRLSVGNAIVIFLVLAALALLVVLELNLKTQILAVIGFCIAVFYPFVKRISMFPQLILGLAFSWGILMAATASLDQWSFEPAIILLFCSNFFWIVAYDTVYAMVDSDDDIKLNIGSLALFAGSHAALLFSGLNSLVLVLWLVMGFVLEATTTYFVVLAIIAALFIYQGYEAFQEDNRAGWFVAFKSNIWVGTALFVAVALGVPPA